MAQKVCYTTLSKMMLDDTSFRLAVMQDPEAALTNHFIEFDESMITALKKFNYDLAADVKNACDEFADDCEFFAC